MVSKNDHIETIFNIPVMVSDERKRGLSFKIPVESLFGIFSLNLATEKSLEKDDASCTNCFKFTMTWSLLVSGFVHAFPIPLKIWLDNLSLLRLLDGGPYTLKYRGSMWGYKRFLRRSLLETSDYLKDDCLKINCTVGVVVSEIHCPRLHSIHVPDSEIGSLFGKLLDTLEGSDVTFDMTFDIAGEKFQAHKLVLAARRTQFFRSTFYNVPEANKNEVVISDLEPKIRLDNLMQNHQLVIAPRCLEFNGVGMISEIVPALCCVAEYIHLVSMASEAVLKMLLVSRGLRVMPTDGYGLYATDIAIQILQLIAEEFLFCSFKDTKLRKFTLELLERFGFVGWNHVSTLLGLNLKLSPDIGGLQLDVSSYHLFDVVCSSLDATEYTSMANVVAAVQQSFHPVSLQRWSQDYDLIRQTIVAHFGWFGFILAFLYGSLPRPPDILSVFRKLCRRKRMMC